MELVLEDVHVELKHLDEKCDLYMGRYDHNNTMALQYKDERGMPVAQPTVNVPHENILPSQVFVKNYSENEGMLDHLLEKDIVMEPERYVKSGHVEVPVCYINTEKLLLDEQPVG
jgi:hypothetical protein